VCNNKGFSMIELSIIDSTGNALLLTTAIHGHSFDAVTCSPRTDGGFGFSLLFYFVDKPYQLSQLEDACRETVARNEVCVLPKSVSAKWRVLLTPTLRSSNQGTRLEAARLMKDLFVASQSQEVAATRLLITHFHYAIKYPEPHVLGILDAIAELMKGSFLGLKVLGFDFNRHSAQFESQVIERFSSVK
jgi:hypothetical protein